MQLIYFAWVKERIGKSEEVLHLPDHVGTVAELLDYLSGINEIYAHALSNRAMLRVAVNQTHVGLDHAVKDTDEIAIFPPVTGG
ncbi:MAG: molybdopterin converting factor subunit 1 [Alphaproteobacteria bacterium]|nr:MAG: molybdopterin converting factor subunit 1 [Alphaproteobacteria bacterium]